MIEEDEEVTFQKPEILDSVPEKVQLSHLVPMMEKTTECDVGPKKEHRFRLHSPPNKSKRHSFLSFFLKTRGGGTMVSLNKIGSNT